MSEYLYVEVSCSGPKYPFWIKQEDVVLAQSQLCSSEEDVARVLRNFLRGLWRKGYISGTEKLVFDNPRVSEAWDLNRFIDQYRGWVRQVAEGAICFDSQADA